MTESQEIGLHGKLTSFIARFKYAYKYEWRCFFDKELRRKYYKREYMKRRRKQYGKGNLLQNKNRKRNARTLLMKKQGGKCAWCGGGIYKNQKRHSDYSCTVDHIKRIEDGGTGSDDNLQLLHLKCHRAKEKLYDALRERGEEDTITSFNSIQYG